MLLTEHKKNIVIPEGGEKKKVGEGEVLKKREERCESRVIDQSTVL